MMPKFVRFYLVSAGVCLMATGLAKLVSASGTAHILETIDPVLGVQFRYVFWIVGAIEVLIALVCFVTNKVALQAGLIALLAFNCIAYRVGIAFSVYHKPCSCLGTLTQALRIAPDKADDVMKLMLVYLFIGSGGTLLWLRFRSLKPVKT